ncbi:MAG: MarR family transcriptional regulator [Veillonella sp.]|nr:MarR family transcriptional regulator [Veillonella sp.]
MRVYNKWHFTIKQALKELNLTHPQFVVLASLAYLSQHDNEVTQVMISKLSGIDVMTVSQILSLLEKRGFVERKEHSRDTRAKAVLLNEKGSEILQKAVPLVELNLNIFLADYMKRKVYQFSDSYGGYYETSRSYGYKYR